MPADRPNVLFIPVDDLRPQLGCYGQDWVASPNIDSLAADGLLFERAYCQQAICAPSRASVLTGCRPDTTGIYDLRTPVRSVMPDVATLPQHFRRNGYETISVGKVYHHRDDDLEGWSAPPVFITGDWKGRGYLTDEAIEAVNAYNAAAEREGLSRRGLGPATECADVDDEAYQDGANAAAAVEQMRRLAAGDAPWFLAAGFIKPHLPFNAPARYWDLYERERLPLAANPFAPEGATDYSLTNFGELRGYTDMPADGPVGEADARRLIHGYCACVSYTDAMVGRLLDELDRLGQRDETIVILWGDHGWKLGEHASWCKHTNFEIDAQAPMILSTPATRGRGLRTSALVEFVDMYPTLADLCGLELPDHLEGTSMGPLLDDPDRAWKPAAFNQYPRGEVMGYALRTDRYRYVEWQRRSDGETLASELYDHETDPMENVNCAAHPDRADTIRELSEMLAAGWRAALPEV